MSDLPKPQKGPKRYRVGLYFFSFLLTLLLIWLGGFAHRDIGQIPRPEIDDSELLKEQEELKASVASIRTSLKIQEEKRDSLKETINTSRDIMGQLREMKKLDLSDENAVLPDELREYLDNQNEVKVLIERIAELKERQRETQGELDGVNKRVTELQRELYRRHGRKIAFFQFAFLAPFVALGAWLVGKKRTSKYAPLIYAFNAAVLFRLFVELHEYFPTKYTKYMFLATAVLVVAGMLVFIVRQMARPGRKWVLQRYREAYDASRCPVCDHPIVSSNMRSVVPNKRQSKGKGTVIMMENEPAQEYSCPECGTELFERCTGCQGLRHSLLPHCIHCGVEKEGAVQS